MKKCPYCKTPLYDDANFCTRCAHKVVEECNCWVKDRPYNCGYGICPGIKLPIIEMRKAKKQGRSHSEL